MPISQERMTSLVGAASAIIDTQAKIITLARDNGALISDANALALSLPADDDRRVSLLQMIGLVSAITETLASSALEQAQAREIIAVERNHFERFAARNNRARYYQARKRSAQMQASDIAGGFRSQLAPASVTRPTADDVVSSSLPTAEEQLAEGIIPPGTNIF